MRVSQQYKLKRKQAELDFVDVPLDTDIPVFVEPTAIRALDTQWSSQCVALLQNFFSNVIGAVKGGNRARAVALLGSLNERNDFHLGYSSGRSRGHAFGKGSAGSVWESLLTSKAAKSGVLSDLEDTALLIDGVGADMISDAVCNIIRAPLIEYTQDMCRYYGIPMVAGVSSGPCWDLQAQNWVAQHVELPMPRGESLVLVPKSIVRLAGVYDVGTYYRNYLLPEMQAQHLASGSSLVEVLKNKKRRVTKKSLMGLYGTSKDSVAKLTEQNPGVLAKYKKEKAEEPSCPISNSQLAEIEGSANVQLFDLYKEVVAIPPGKAHAYKYERAIEGLLSALFYPSLVHPVRQGSINQGRKIVDLRFTNAARAGFFRWVADHYTAPYVFVEFKNYSEDVKNPELDQLSGRFSKSGGQVGILICRNVSDRSKIDAICRDAAKDGRGYMIVLDDDDLKALVMSTSAMHFDAARTILNERFSRVAL